MPANCQRLPVSIAEMQSFGLVFPVMLCISYPVSKHMEITISCTKLENDYQVKESLLPKSELIHQHHTCNTACCIITERRPEIHQHHTCNTACCIITERRPELMIHPGRRQKISPRSQTECRVINQVWSMGCLHLSAAVTSVSWQIPPSQLCNNLLLCF